MLEDLQAGIKMERAMGIENNPRPAWFWFPGSCRIFSGFRFIAYTYEVIIIAATGYY